MAEAPHASPLVPGSQFWHESVQATHSGCCLDSSFRGLSLSLSHFLTLPLAFSVFTTWINPLHLGESKISQKLFVDIFFYTLWEKEELFFFLAYIFYPALRNSISNKYRNTFLSESFSSCAVSCMSRSMESIHFSSLWNLEAWHFRTGRSSAMGR